MISVLSGGSVVQALSLGVSRNGKVARIRAIPDGKYVLAPAEGSSASGDIFVKRFGKRLSLGREADDREALVIEDYFGSHCQLFGLDAVGRYQPYVIDGVAGSTTSDITDGGAELLQVASLATGTPSALTLSELAALAQPVASSSASPPAALVDTFNIDVATAAMAGEAEKPHVLPNAAGEVVLAAIAPEVAAQSNVQVPEVEVELIAVAQAESMPASAPPVATVIEAASAVGVLAAAAAERVLIPVIDALWDDQGAVQGIIANGAVTDDGRPQIVGKADSGVIVHIYSGINLIGHAVAGSNGEWSFTPMYPMADGRHEISIVHEYPDGEVSEDSAPYVIIVDKVIPDIPLISGMLDDEGRIQGQLVNGSTTDDNTPTISGSAEPLATLIIYDKGKEIGRVPVDADGKWSFTPSAPLADGLHILDYAAVDRAGNISEKSNATELLVDTRPELVDIYAAEDDVGEVRGTFMTGGVTDDTQPRLFGSATAGGVVKIYEGSQLLGTVTAGVDGKWEFTPPTAMAEGTHSLTATVTTDAKGESARSPSFNFSVDVTAPEKPTIEQVYDDRGGWQGALSNGQSTDDTTPTLSGAAEAGSTVRIYGNGSLLGTTLADQSGVWSFVPNPALTDGDYLFTVTAQDKAGSVSAPSDGFAVNIDTIPAPAPVIESVYDDQGAQTGMLNSGDSTDDSKPTISGRAEANAVVIIRDSGLEIGRTTADVDGKWVFEPFLPMGLGDHKLTAVAVDAAGNVSAPSNQFELTLGNPEPPAQPAITSVVDDVGALTGNLQKNDVTDDARPTINGTAQAGMTVSVYVDNTLLGSTVASASGEWSYTPATDLADGLHNITAKATNSLGNSSVATGPYPIVVDTTPPSEPLPTDAALWDDAGQITGQIINGTVTDDNTPTFIGKAEPNATVVIYDGGVKIGTAATNENGEWRFTPSPVLSDGEHKLSYLVVDKAGNVGPKSKEVSFQVDTRDVLISIDGAIDDAGSIKGNIVKSGVTDDTTPTLHGVATAGGTVKIYEGGTLLGQAVAGSDGKWSFAPSVALSEGAHVLTATVTTTANGESAKSAPFDFTIDISAPLKPTIEQVVDDVGTPQGTLSRGQATDDTTPTLSGKAEAGSTVRVYDHGSLLGSAQADASGNWSFTPNPPLLNGARDFTVTAEDAAGNVSDASDVFGIVIDTIAPDAPVIVSVYDDQGNQKGFLNSGDATDDTKPTLAGTAEPNSIVIIKDDGHEIGRAAVGADGRWTFEPTLPMGLGQHKLTAVAVDAAGNISGASNQFELMLGNPDQPTAPAITSVFDDVGSITGNIQKNAVTDDARPTINGTAQPGMTVSIYIDHALAGTAVVTAGGEWSFTPLADLADGLHEITATATNALGNISPETGAYPIVVDTTPPTAPAASDAILWDDAGTITGAIISGMTTDDNTPTFKGTAEPNATVAVYDAGVWIGSALSNAAGEWTFTPSPVLVDGRHALNYEVVDAAGNVSPRSEAIVFDVDTSKLEVSIDGAMDDVGSITGSIMLGGVTDDRTPTLHGKATAGGTVKIYEGSALLGEVVAGGDGKWSFTPATGLSEGAHVLTATVTTLANGESSRSSEFDFSIDVTAPQAPTIVLVTDDVGAQQGALSPGQRTDDTTPTLSGKAEVGSTVHVYDDGSLLGKAIADGDGNWSFTPNPPLLNGSHVFTVSAADKAGNMSASSQGFAIEIDTVPPAAPVIETVYDDQGARTGNLAAGATTDDSRPKIQGSAEPGSTVILKDGELEIARLVADASGKWEFEPTSAMAEGAHMLTAEAIDAAGNVSQPSSGFGFAVDTSLPTTPKISNVSDDVGKFIGLIKSGGSTDDTQPTINGTGKAGELIELYRDGTLVGSTVVGATGRWNFTPETSLEDGLYGWTAVAVSSGGAESSVSNRFEFTVDTVAPDRPVIESVYDNAGSWQGNLENGNVTDDRTPTFSGKAEPGSTILVFDQGEEVGFAAVAADGSWKYSTEILSLGEHTFTFKAVDVAANVSEASQEWGVYITVATRSAAADASHDVTPSFQDLLLDGPSDFFAAYAAPNAAPVDAASAFMLQVHAGTGQQDSWATSSAQLPSNGEWAPTGQVDVIQPFEQQWVG